MSAKPSNPDMSQALGGVTELISRFKEQQANWWSRIQFTGHFDRDLFSAAKIAFFMHALSTKTPVHDGTISFADASNRDDIIDKMALLPGSFVAYDSGFQALVIFNNGAAMFRWFKQEQDDSVYLSNYDIITTDISIIEEFAKFTETLSKVTSEST